MIPQELKYSKDHEWIKIDGLRATIGITHHAQDQLGDIVYVEVPAVGDEITRDETFGVVESVKTVSDLFAPVDGKVVEQNPKMVEDNDDFAPEIINSSPYEDGWMIVVEVEDESKFDGLLDADGYKQVIESDD